MCGIEREKDTWRENKCRNKNRRRVTKMRWRGKDEWIHIEVSRLREEGRERGRE